MSTLIRPEITKRNPYWISKHRYYELKHFCLQYSEWMSELNSMSVLFERNSFCDILCKSTEYKDPTAELVMAREFYISRIEMVQKAAKETDTGLSEYLIKGITQGLSYQNLKLVHGLPCCKDVYYDLYRKFFFLLSELRE